MPSFELRKIRKSFAGLPALSDVSLTLQPGRVHGLLGENGAGKSTLMNILYGLLRPDAGQITVDSKSITIRSPHDAIKIGIGMVHQHFMLAGALSILDNVLLGDRRQHQLLPRRALARRLLDLSTSIGLDVNPHARVDDLSVGARQRVEILKALHRDVRVLILDEPTAVLTPLEVDQLFTAINRLRDRGTAVVFISHKLKEVKRICEDVTVLRKGAVVWQGQAKDVSAEDLAHHMVGHQVAEIRNIRPESSTASPAILQLRNVAAAGLSTVDLSIGPEIFGIAGVDGNGQQELAEVLVGLRPTTSGQISLNGVDVTSLNLSHRAALGVGHIPNDRKREGLVGAMSVAENIALKHHGRAPFRTGPFISWGRVRNTTQSIIARFDIRSASVHTSVARLSGGNQQKVILARELAVVEPKLIVATNPVRGLDIGATNFVYQQLLAHRQRGCAVILISSDLDELLRLSDRIAVLYQGRLTLTGFPSVATDTIARLMAGLT